MGERIMLNSLLKKPAAVRQEELETLLQCRLGNRVRELSVLVLAGGIILQGRTATYHAKQLAQHAAMELCSLPILANDIEVI
jgi:hypothetical protein